MCTTTCVHLLPYYTHRTHTAPSYNLGIRIPPSKRIDSAFMMGDSTKNYTNSANSDGTPNRSVGNTCAFFKLSPTRAPAGVLKPAVKGVAMIPGMMVLILTPLDPMSLSNKKRKQQETSQPRCHNYNYRRHQEQCTTGFHKLTWPWATPFPQRPLCWHCRPLARSARPWRRPKRH